MQAHWLILGFGKPFYGGIESIILRVRCNFNYQFLIIISKFVVVRSYQSPCGLDMNYIKDLWPRPRHNVALSTPF